MLDNITFCHGIHGTCSCTHTDTQSHTHTHIHTSHAWCIWWPGWAVGAGGGGISASIYLITIPYSRKYWRALNLAVEPQIAIRRILVDLNLAVRYGIAM